MCDEEGGHKGLQGLQLGTLECSMMRARIKGTHVLDMELQLWTP